MRQPHATVSGRWGEGSIDHPPPNFWMVVLHRRSSLAHKLRSYRSGIFDELNDQTTTFNLRVLKFIWLAATGYRFLGGCSVYDSPHLSPISTQTSASLRLVVGQDAGSALSSPRVRLTRGKVKEGSTPSAFACAARTSMSGRAQSAEPAIPIRGHAQGQSSPCGFLVLQPRSVPSI